MAPKKLWDRCIREPYDPEAWEALLLYLRPLLIRRVTRIAHLWSVPPDALEDLLQDVCLKIARSYRSMRVPEDTDEFNAYIGKFTENAALDQVRARYAKKRNPTREIAFGSLRERLAVPEVEWKAADSKIWLREIDEALEAKPRDRTVFWLYYRQGYTAKEIAQIPSLKLTTEGVESVLHRLVVALRNKFAGTRQVAGSEGD